MATLPLHELADELWSARVNGTPIEPLSTRFPGLGLGDAYRISQLNFHRRTRTSDARAIGRKIGLTSRAVQKQLGVDQPDYGYLTHDMRIEEGGQIPARALLQGRVEAEVAFVLKKGLRGPGVTASDVEAATEFVSPCLEIIDSRIRDWKITAADTIADNASAAYFVLGDTRRRLEGLELRLAGMTLRRNGEIESSGVGAACLDHPILAVSWLANALAAFEEGLKPGDVVLSGAFGPVVPLNPGDRCEAEINGLGKVSCSYARGESG